MAIAIVIIRAPYLIHFVDVHPRHPRQHHLFEYEQDSLLLDYDMLGVGSSRILTASSILSSSSTCFSPASSLLNNFPMPASRLQRTQATQTLAHRKEALTLLGWRQEDPLQAAWVLPAAMNAYQVVPDNRLWMYITANQNGRHVVMWYVMTTEWYNRSIECTLSWQVYKYCIVVFSNVYVHVITYAQDVFASVLVPQSNPI